MNTEIDMGKVNEWLGTVRDTFINASELAKTVASLQEQVNSMSQNLEGLRALNRTLDENLSWSRSERDRLDGELRQSQGQLVTALNERAQIDNERQHFKSLADERASIIATLKSDNDSIAFRNLELEEENGKLKAMSEAVANAVLQFTKTVSIGAAGTGQAQVVEAPKTEPQPRDPVTQQWRPKAAYYDDKGDYHPAQVDDPNLPINPVEDWGKTGSGSGF